VVGSAMVVGPEWLGKQLEKASPDLLREMVMTFVAALMGAEVDAICGAEYAVVSADRVNSRNGAGPRRPGHPGPGFDPGRPAVPDDLRRAPAAARPTTAKMPLHEVDLDVLAGRTNGLSGADLEALCQQKAVRTRQVSMADRS
jgi:hypothetical protein